MWEWRVTILLNGNRIIAKRTTGGRAGDLDKQHPIYGIGSFFSTTFGCKDLTFKTSLHTYQDDYPCNQQQSDDDP